MKLRAVLVAVALIAVSCRTGRPTGAPVSPLTASTAEEAAAQLRQRRAEFRGMKSMMWVRARANGENQTFRAQLAVHDPRRMELIAYTPIGTTALKMSADGDRITSEPEVRPGAFEFLRLAGLTPAETGMLLLGLPPREGMALEMRPTGIASATLGDITLVYDPPAFPAKRVVVTRGADRVELEHAEVVQ